jgi:hypothetical protein
MIKKVQDAVSAIWEREKTEDLACDLLYRVRRRARDRLGLMTLFTHFETGDRDRRGRHRMMRRIAGRPRSSVRKISGRKAAAHLSLTIEFTSTFLIHHEWKNDCNSRGLQIFLTTK